MMKDETTGYHIFLEPEGALKDELAGSIRSLAQAYGGPVFPPHVTLLGPIEGQDEETVIDKAATLAAGFAPLILALGDVGGEDSYFRAFYIRIEEPGAITGYHERARTAFGLPADAYLPHVSLFYGMIPAATRDTMTASIGYPKGASFTTGALSVYRTEGRADAWQRVAHIPLAGTVLD